MFNVKKSFVALSLVGLFAPIGAAAVQGIDNTNDPKKQQTVGTATGGDTLSGSISTHGSNANTIVNFRSTSKMENGQISAVANTAQQGAGGAGASNQITLEENSVLNLNTTATTYPPAGGAAGQAAGQQGTANPAYSIIAVNAGAQNTIGDVTTGTAIGSISGAIMAKDGGLNTIFNLRNHGVKGPIIAEGNGSANNISFDSGTTLTSYIKASTKPAAGAQAPANPTAQNTIQFNNGAKFNGTTDTGIAVDGNEKASILAEGEGASNTITGTSTDSGTISGNIVTRDKGSNTITLQGLQAKGDIVARDEGQNTITLTNGYLTNVATQGSNAKNTITLNGNASIKGFITNRETQTGMEGTNTIILNEQSSLDLHKGNNTDGSAIFTSKKVNNTISGNSTGTHKIEGNITAKTEGKNTIVLTTLTMNGNTNADGGVNDITLGVTGEDQRSSITGNIIAQNGDYQAKLAEHKQQLQQAKPGGPQPSKMAKATNGLNQIDFLNVNFTGNVEAKSDGQNILNLRDTKITGSITSENQANNYLTLGNGGTNADITGYIKAQTNGNNIIEFNNGSVEGGIFAEGANATNTITLGNSTYTGTIKSNITATDSGKNTIDIESVNMTGSIIAQKQGSNTITDKAPMQNASVIDGGIVANDDGTNTMTLKNITITKGITASGKNAKNIATLGDQANGIITSGITATKGGDNTIAFKNNLNLIGDIKAEADSKNTISEDAATTTQSLVQGQILADGGQNAINLAHTIVTDGIVAQNTGTNTINIATTKPNDALISDVTALSGGTNTATLGSTNPQNQSGILEGTILAKSNGSKNEFTLHHASIIRKGSITADTTENTADAVASNTITLNDTSYVALEGPVIDGITGYAIYATGQNAKNTITDNGTGTSTIDGTITADNGADKADAAKAAINTLTFKNLVMTGDVNAYNTAKNTLTLTNGSLTGVILAQSKGANALSFETGGNFEVAGTFSVNTGGINTITLNDNAMLTINSQNNPMAFQASDEGSSNTFTENNANATNNQASISGEIYATKQGKNEINVRALEITGDVISEGGTNTITIGGGKIDGLLKGGVIANSADVIAFGNLNSVNTITLNQKAKMQGYFEAQGSNTEVSTTNTLTLNDTASVSLTGSAITDKGGTALGSGNDAIFSETQRAYNKIDDKGTGENTIKGNIYAKDNSVDPNQIQNIDSGNDITLKKVTMTGNVMADTRGKNILNFGAEGGSLSGNISAVNYGQNTINFGATGKTSQIAGNVSAISTGVNKLTLTDTAMNNVQAMNFLITASAMQKDINNPTSNEIILNGSSTLNNTALSATQEGILGPVAGIADGTSAQNILTLNGTSAIHLVTNANVVVMQEDVGGIGEGGDNPVKGQLKYDGIAILAMGLWAKNKITDAGNGENTITGHIVADYGAANNNIQLNKIVMEGDVIADDNASNTISFGKDANSGSFYGNIRAYTRFGLSKNTATFTNMILGGDQLKGIIASSGSLNGATNDIKLNSTSMSNYYANATGSNAKNTIKLDANASISLSANPQDTNALFASGNGASNTITDENNNNTKSNTITGNLHATNLGKNEVDLNMLVVNGDFNASKAGSNILSTQTSGNITSSIISAINANSANTITLTGSYAFNINGQEDAILADDSGKNTITGGSTAIANTTNNITGSITAKQKGSNVITLDSLTLNGDMKASDTGTNTLTFGATGKATTINGNAVAEDGVNTITLTAAAQNGSMIASGSVSASNTTTLNSSKLTGYLSAIATQPEPEPDPNLEGGGDVGGENNGADAGRDGQDVERDGQGGNPVAAADAQPDAGANGGGGDGQDPANADTGGDTGDGGNGVGGGDGGAEAPPAPVRVPVSNTLTLADANSSIALVASEEGNAVYASGLAASNKVEDKVKTTETNTITGNIAAIDSGSNTMSLQNINMTGDITAHHSASNTITFGQEAAQNQVNTFTGNILANDAQNTITLQKMVVKASVQALTDNSINNITFKNVTLNDGYFVAIADQDEKDAKNTITIDAHTSLNLKGAQVVDSTGANVGSGNDAIYTQGEKAKNIINWDSTTHLTHTINGNITADSGASNAYTFNKGVTMQGGFRATSLLKPGAENEITLKNDSKIKDGIILARGANVSNILNFQNESNLTNSSLQAIKEGEDQIDEQGVITIATAKNTLNLTGSAAFFSLVSSQDEIAAAVYASGLGAGNEIKSGPGTITGNIIAVGGAQNTISHLYIQKGAQGGAGGGGGVQPQNQALNITGDIFADDNAVNAITLQAASKLTSTTIEATNGGRNKILFEATKNNPTAALTGSFSIINTNNTQAMLASGTGGGNELISPSTTKSTISGNIIALDGGFNLIEKVDHYTLSNASIAARGDGSKNSIIASNDSQITLMAASDKNAIYATGFQAENKITDNANSSVHHTITGNITADSGAINTISMLSLTTTGHLIATNAGSNTLTLGGAQNQQNKPATSFTGAMMAMGESATNTLNLQQNSNLFLQKDDTTNNYAAYASGIDAKNTINDNSTKSSTITGDVGADASGANIITLLDATFAGDVYASNGGTNTITFTKGKIAPKDPNAPTILTQKISSIGANALNVLNYNETNFSSGEIIADQGGENRLFLKLPQPQTPADPLKFDVFTGDSAINKAVAQGISAAEAKVNYAGGMTTLVFSQNKTTSANAGGDITAAAYQDGVLLILDGVQANGILNDFRDLQAYSANYTRFYMKDLQNHTLSGTYVGSINFLQTSTQVAAKTTLTLEQDAALIAALYTNGKNTLSMELNPSSKWIVMPAHAGSGVIIEKLTGKNLEDKRADEGDTLRQDSAVIDLATGGYDTKYGVQKSDFTSLILNDTSGLLGTTFRVYADTINRQADTATINKSSDEQKKEYLQAYYTADSLRSASQYHYNDNNSASNTLVATVDKGQASNFEFDISTPSTVEQGYLLVTTSFIKKTEQRVPLAGATPGTQGTVDNYYIGNYSAKINPKEAAKSYSLISVNYLVFLANTNNINKRLGEMRDGNYSHGLWIRGYGGQIWQNRGVEVTNNYISTQLGYDFGWSMKNGMQFVGFSFGYGDNHLKSRSDWRMRSTYLSGGIYYSYVKDSGFYSDTIIKYDYIDTKPVSMDDFSARLTSSVISLNQELGYRAYFDAKRRFFFEGNIEAMGGYMMGFSAMQSRTRPGTSTNPEAQLKSSSPNTFVFRGIAGGVFGYRLKTKKNQTDFRLGASYVADYALGKMQLDVGNGIVRESQPFGFNQMVIGTLGINTMLTKNLRMYFEFEMGFLGKIINHNYLGNIGLRYTFGAQKRESSFGNVEEQEQPDFRTLNIEAPKVKCNGCNPESGYYLELLRLGAPSQALENYLSRYNYRAYSADNQTGYYIGPFKTLKEAKAQQDQISKLAQALSKNPRVKSEIYKINNKAKN